MAIKKSGHKQKHTSKSNTTVKYFKENSVVVTTRAQQLSYKKTWQSGCRRDFKATQRLRATTQERYRVAKGKRDAFRNSVVITTRAQQTVKHIINRTDVGWG